VEVSAVVLAGGRSHRLGRDKLGELVGGRSLLQRVLDCVVPLTPEVILVVAQDQVPPVSLPRGVRVVVDLYSGRGPLVGIYSGLRAVRRLAAGLVVGGDMPFLNASLLCYLIGLADEADAIVPRVDNLVEPLHAVYSPACLDVIGAMLEEGSLSVMGLLERVKVRYVEEGELRRLDPELLSLFNVNTEAALRKARRIADRGVGHD